MDVESFIARWTGHEGGQERANYALFLTELCDALDVPRPDPANTGTESNDYVFERAVKETARDGSTSQKRIDLYKRDAFVLEAKQSRLEKEGKAVAGQGKLFEVEEPLRGRRGANRAWDVLMMGARTQAENYVRLLPADHAAPPFVLVCDVGHCLEVYANFRRDGKAYEQFPDRRGFRVYLEDLRDEKVRQRLKAIWTDPQSLDPTRHAARVTRDIAMRLANVSKALEKEHKPDAVAMFLMRCLFTMFAEDVGLLPKSAFTEILRRCEKTPDAFPHEVGQLWEAMDKGEYAHALHAKVKKFNGEFFRKPVALALSSEAIFELRAASSHDWKDVEPAIFGTLVEQALEPKERKKLGAHYTPRAYVERLVRVVVIEPLRADWENTLGTIERLKAEKKPEEAIGYAKAFHDALCATRVLDPACGTGNFLYVALELLKRLEGEVLEVLANLGGQEALAGLEGHTVDPHQFLGLELNARAAAIAELVLWIGYLQWHYRTSQEAPAEPILKAFRNIQRKDAVLTPDLSKRPEWPEADFIVGNPPFIGGKDVRARLGDDYAQALWTAHKPMNESADFVMYWWDRAAELLTRKGSKLRRFGFVSTNSISQLFQRRVMERHLTAKKPVSLVFAIPDHPWTKAGKDAAAVRIAMTAAEAGKKEGALYEVTREAGLDTDEPTIELKATSGVINSDLTVGVDVTQAVAMKANEGVCSPGVKLHGAGFIVTPAKAAELGLGRVPGLENHIRPYRNGRDLTAHPRGVMVIDLFGLTADEVRERFPAVYQHVLATVKPERDANNRSTYRENWCIFGEPRKDIRPALAGVARYIATVETSKHRVFQFLEAGILPDNRLVCFALEKAQLLGVLSSRIHIVWSLAVGGTLEDRPIYTKSICFDPFPFPAATEAQSTAIAALAEELDAHRKRVLGQHPHLTLTGLYNVLERIRAGAALEPVARPAPGRVADLDARNSASADAPPLTAAERRIFDDGLVLILKELHDKLDAAVADAYGWPQDLADEEILARLVALNKQRAREEARGLVRWLRPDYQIPRFGTAKEKAQLALEGGGMGDGTTDAAPKTKAAFPDDPLAQTAAVMAALANASAPLDARALAQGFRQGRKAEARVAAVLGAIERMGFASAREGRYTLRAAA